MDPRLPPRLPPRLLAVVVAAAVVVGAWLHRGYATLDPTARDQVHDFSLALRLREAGTLSDGNRHPLLPALLAPWARREPGFFDDAALVGAVVGAAGFAAVALAAARVYGPALGLLAALGLLGEWLRQARRIAPEPLLAALLVLAASAAATVPRARRPALAAAGAGALLGLAWLAKASALLSLGATVVVLALARGRRRTVPAALVGFVVAAAPLLAWNVAHGHAPTWNVNSAHVMWEDAWDVELDRRSEAGPATWARGHDLGDAVGRLGRGLLDQRGVEWVYGFLGALALAALASRRRPGGARGATVAGPDGAEPWHEDPRRRWRALALVSSSAWLLPMAWYAPIVASRRLLFPVFAVLLPPALDALLAVARAGAPDATARARSLAARAGGLAVATAGAPVVSRAALVATAPPRATPAALDATSRGAARALAAASADGVSRVLVRPSRTVPADWLWAGPAAAVALPAAVPDDAVAAFLAREADAVLLNEGLLRHRPAAFARWARWDEAAGALVLAPEVVAAARFVADGPRPRYALVDVARLPR